MTNHDPRFSGFRAYAFGELIAEDEGDPSAEILAEAHEIHWVRPEMLTEPIEPEEAP